MSDKVYDTVMEFVASHPDVGVSFYQRPGLFEDAIFVEMVEIVNCDGIRGGKKLIWAFKVEEVLDNAFMGRVLVWLYEKLGDQHDNCQ